MTLIEYLTRKNNIYISYCNRLTTFSNKLINYTDIKSDHCIPLKISINVLYDNLYNAFNFLFDFKNISNVYEMNKKIDTYIKSFDDIKDFLLAGSTYEVLEEEKDLIQYTLNMLNYYKFDIVDIILTEAILKSEKDNISDYIKQIQDSLREKINKGIAI